MLHTSSAVSPMSECGPCYAQELQNISSHLSQLRVAAARLAESREALTQLDSHIQRQKQKGETAEVLVPLTGALYAKVASKNTFLPYTRVSMALAKMLELAIGAVALNMLWHMHWFVSYGCAGSTAVRR